MSKKHLIPLLALAIVMPFAIAHGETIGDTEGGTMKTTTSKDCGSAPTAPGAGATVQERQQYRKDLRTYRQCTRQKDQEAKTQDRCDIINQRITDRLNNFQNKQNGDSTIFGNVYKRLTNIQVRLKNAGLDTSKLVADLATLKTKIDKVNADYASFIAGLKATAGFTCGHSQGEFMGKLGAARGILMSVRADRQAVRSYIVGTIIPDIKALRQQLVKTEGTHTDTNPGSSSSPQIEQ